MRMMVLPEGGSNAASKCWKQRNAPELEPEYVERVVVVRRSDAQLIRTMNVLRSWMFVTSRDEGGIEDEADEKRWWRSLVPFFIVVVISLRLGCGRRTT